VRGTKDDDLIGHVVGQDLPGRNGHMRLTGKVAIVTGASSGIGRASAALFAVEGARVVCADVNVAGGDETVSAIQAKGGDAVFVETDVSRASDVERLVATAVSHYSCVDILFNVAGVYMRRTPVDRTEESLWDRIYNVNVKSVFLGAKYAVPRMKENGGGIMINTASMTAVGLSREVAAYASSKGAVITLTKVLAAELAPFNIRVNCICPTITDTPMVREELEQMRRTARPANVLQGPAKPEDIASAALFLASAESSMISGACIEVSGGRGN
jgi:3-oxoacyl-[acyl-carrier protein] reductase